MTRIATNYARLAAGLVAGMLLVRVLLRLGPEAFGAVLVLGVATGLAMSLQDFLTTGLVPEIAAAFHRRHNASDELGHVLAAARRLCRRAAMIAAACFLAAAAIAPLAGFPSELVGAVRWFLAAKAVEWFVGVLSAPDRGLCFVTERTTTLNAWVVAERFADVAAAAFAVLWIAPDAPATAIAWYGITGACMTSATTLFGMLCARRIGAGVVAAPPRQIDSDCRKRVWKSIAANSTVGVAMNLYIRAALLIVQLVSGVVGAFAFGLAAQFSFYLRQAGMGLVLGIDGVAARTQSDAPGGLASLLRRSMRWQALVVFPGALVSFLYAEPLLELWAGPRITAAGDQLHWIGGLVRILLVGVTARALSESWMRALTGVGHAAAIAGPIVAGAAISPIVCLIAAVVVPSASQAAAVATSLSLAMVLVHAVALPFWTARRLGLSPADFYAPLVAPLVACLLASAALAVLVQTAPGLSCGAPVSSFCLAYALLAPAIVVDAGEWRRLHHALSTSTTGS